MQAIGTFLCDIQSMSKASDLHVLPFEMAQGLRDLGANLARARLARGDTQRTAAERCGLHPQTVARIERGDPGVAIGKVFSVMHIYGQGSRVHELARTDEAMEILYRHHLPKRGGKKS